MTTTAMLDADDLIRPVFPIATSTPSRSERSGGLPPIVADLLAVRTSAALPSAAAQAVARLGYDVGFFSLLTDGGWVVQAVHDTEGIGATSGDALSEPVPLGSPEHQAMQLQRSIRVASRECSAALGRAFDTDYRRGTIDIAPVFVDVDPIGLLHGVNWQSGTPSTDLDALAVIGQVCALIHQRLRVQESLMSVGRELSAYAGALTSLPSGSVRPAPSIGRPALVSLSASPVEDQLHLGSSEGVLTRREREVLMLVAQGYTNARIAQRLFIQSETVKAHITRILRKLGASNRAQAVAYWHKHGDGVQ